MIIGILNLPFDANYGGNLQRYALVKVLTDRGHDVTCFFVEPVRKLVWYKKPYSYSKRLMQKIFINHSMTINLEKKINDETRERNKKALEFYEKYIPHTASIHNVKDLLRINYSSFDVIIVGSDQVWRKSYTKMLGLDNYFLSFVPDSVRKIAYGASFGSKDNELTQNDIKRIGKLYKRLNGVSVRENGAIKLIKEQYHWHGPEPLLVLDPTLLLDKEHYLDLISKGNCKDSSKNINVFCYILDKANNKIDEINDFCRKNKLKHDILDFSNIELQSIETWLAAFNDVDYVITDSFHGCVFSIIFQKQFAVFDNASRGNDRISNLLKLLDLEDRIVNFKDSTVTDVFDKAIDYRSVEKKLYALKKSSINYIEKSLYE